MDKYNSSNSSIEFKNFMSKDEVLYIESKRNGTFNISFIDIRLNRQSEHFDVLVEDLPGFLDYHHCENVKAAIFVIDNMESELELENLSFRQMVYEQLSKLSCHIYFTDPQKFLFSSMLTKANIPSNPGEVILAVVIMYSNIYVCELRRKQEDWCHTKHDGYSLIRTRTVIWRDRSLDDVNAEILGSWNSNNVIITDYTNDNDSLVTNLKSHVFQSKNVFVARFMDHPCYYIPQFLHSWTNRHYWKFKALPSFLDTIAVTNELNMVDLKNAAICIKEPKEVPFRRAKVVSKSKEPYYVAFFTSGKYEVAVKAESINEKCHRIKLVLSVNRNALPFLNQHPFIIPEIETFPQKLTSQYDLNIPFIGFYDNSSVICARSENGYNFLETWNGLYGNDLYLSFKKKQAAIVTDLNKVKNNDPFMVYDLIRIIMMQPNDIRLDPKWGFKLTRNAKNPVLFEYVRHNGKRKASTPIDLMALLIDLHLSVIKKETGRLPSQLGFQLFYNLETRKCDRINYVLKEACKRLKIDFVTL